MSVGLDSPRVPVHTPPAFRVTHDVLAFVRAAGAAAYPDECCGVLEGVVDADGVGRHIVRAYAATNADVGRRFLIPAAAVRTAEIHAARAGRTVVGFYHSHPDTAAHPSRADGEGAWPWYVYLIVPVGHAGGVCAWRLADDRTHFDAARLEEID